MIALVASAAVGGPPLDVDVARYEAADGSGTLAVRVYAERRRPAAADIPLIGTIVTLLPRSLALLGRLDGLRAAARESSTAYRDAAPAMRRVRDDLEIALREAGAGGLVRTASVDSGGRIVFDEIPAGDWVLVAWRSVPVDEDRRHRGGGYRAVSVWVREILLARGARETMELTDRNVWFSGVEEAKPGAGR